jgi:hypothetical protein
MSQRKRRWSLWEISVWWPIVRTSPSDVFSVKVRCLPADEGFERPLQDRRPIKIPFVVRHSVHPLPVFVYRTRRGTRYPFALDEPGSKIWPMPDWVKRLPPGRPPSVHETSE